MIHALIESALFAPALAVVAATLMFIHDRRGRPDRFELATLVVLVPLAGAVALAPVVRPLWPVLTAGFVVALLAREHATLLPSECGVKILWVMGAALALSWAGMELLVLATGTQVVIEQWSVLNLGVDPEFLWSTALPLSLLFGVVLLGGAPFHFWAADLLQGAPAWLAPLAAAALQVSGAEWLAARLEGIEAFAPGAREVTDLLSIAALIAFAVGAVTLLVQRSPERRIGTLAGLNGGLLLASLAFTHGASGAGVEAGHIARWVAHMALALTGAGILARFLPVAGATPRGATVLFRRHPFSGLAGCYALGSLAGVPGTPGARLWLEAAHGAVRGGRVGFTLALGAAWLIGFAASVRQLREAFGIATDAPAPSRPVAWQARAALWVCAAGLVALMWR